MAHISESVWIYTYTRRTERREQSQSIWPAEKEERESYFCHCNFMVPAPFFAKRHICDKMFSILGKGGRENAEMSLAKIVNGAFFIMRHCKSDRGENLRLVQLAHL